MPRRRRVAKARDTGTRVTESPPNVKWEQLMTGDGFGDGTGFEPGDEAAKRDAWEFNREALLRVCREREGPGHRPWDGGSSRRPRHCASILRTAPVISLSRRRSNLFRPHSGVTALCAGITSS